MPTSRLPRFILACSAACFTDKTTSISKRERGKPTSPTWLLKRSSTALSSKRDATKLCGSPHLPSWVVSWVRPCSTAAKFSSLVQPKGDDMLCAMQCVIFCLLNRCAVLFSRRLGIFVGIITYNPTTHHFTTSPYYLFLLLLTPYHLPPYY